MAVERDEIPAFEDFYKPLTSREQTLLKLQVLRARPMVEVGNADLFEALADTFATLGREDYENGRFEELDGVYYPFGDWYIRDEVWINEEGSQCIGLWRNPADGGDERLEQVFIDGVFPGYVIDFDRSQDGSVRTSTEESYGDDGAQTPHEVTDTEKEVILDACIASFSS